MTRRAALRGDLSLLAPEILVQMLAMGRVSGCLTLRHAPQACRVYLSDGRITYACLIEKDACAEVDPEVPVRERVCDALGVALGWDQGSFSFERGAAPIGVGETLNSDPQELLLDCLSRVRTKGGGDEDGRV